jgi:hypothetical protein
MSEVLIKPWKDWEKVFFRFFFLFFSILILPLDWKFWRQLFAINWGRLHFHDLFELTRYQLHIFPAGSFPAYGPGSFADWGVVILISLIGTAIWGRVDDKRQEYDQLYYWLRVIIRYRLALLLITYGFIKLFPLQMPYPSLSNLLTNYGDFYAWKIYFQTLGISPHYESFLGFVEIVAALLLFNRRTVTFGVGLIFGFIGNVAVANGFYDIGEQVLSTFIVVMAAALFVKDIPRLYNLLVKEKATRANKFVPDLSSPFLRRARLGLRYAFLFFALVFAWRTYDSYVNDPYKLPHTPGLSNAFGIYNVKEFVVNRDTLPYSKTDPQRWQDVVFEKWSTLTIKDARPVLIDKSSGEAYHDKDIDRNYELAGFAGRHYFYYEADTVNQVLRLQNKNSQLRDEKLLLSYSRPNDSTILLSGINERSDSIHVVLEKISKKYLMLEGRRRPVKS